MFVFLSTVMNDRRVVDKSEFNNWTGALWVALSYVTFNQVARDSILLVFFRFGRNNWVRLKHLIIKLTFNLILNVIR